MAFFEHPYKNLKNLLSRILFYLQSKFPAFRKFVSFFSNAKAYIKKSLGFKNNEMTEAILRGNIEKIFQISEKNPDIFLKPFPSNMIFKALNLFFRPELQEKYSFARIEKILDKLFAHSVFSEQESKKALLKEYCCFSYISDRINLYHANPDEKINSRYQNYIKNPSKTREHSNPQEFFFQTIILFASEPAKNENILKKILSLEHSVPRAFLLSVADDFKYKLGIAFGEDNVFNKNIIYDNKLERYRANILILFEIISAQNSENSADSKKKYLQIEEEIRFFAKRDPGFSVNLIASMNNPANNSFHLYAAKYSVKENILKYDGKTLQNYILKIFAHVTKFTAPDSFKESDTIQASNYYGKYHSQICEDSLLILFQEICKVKDKPAILEQALRKLFVSLVNTDRRQLAKTLLQEYKHDPELNFVKGLFIEEKNPSIDSFVAFYETPLKECLVFDSLNILLETYETDEIRNLVLSYLQERQLKLEDDKTSQSFIKLISYFIDKTDGKYSADLKKIIHKNLATISFSVFFPDFKKNDPQLVGHLDLLDEIVTNFTRESPYIGSYFVNLFAKLNENFLGSDGKIHPYISKSLEIFKHHSLKEEFNAESYYILSDENFSHFLASFERILSYIQESIQESNNGHRKYIKQIINDVIDSLLKNNLFEKAESVLEIFSEPDRKIFLEQYFTFYSKLNETQKAGVASETLLFYMNNYLELVPNFSNFEEFEKIFSDLILSEKIIFHDDKESFKYISKFFEIFEKNPKHEDISKFADILSAKILSYYRDSGKKEKKFNLAICLANKSYFNFTEKLLGFELDKILDESQFKKFKDFVLHLENLTVSCPKILIDNSEKISLLLINFFSNNLRLCQESGDFSSLERNYNLFAGSKFHLDFFYHIHPMKYKILSEFELNFIFEIFKNKGFVKNSENFFLHAVKFLAKKSYDDDETSKKIFSELCDLVVYSIENDDCDHITTTILTEAFAIQVKLSPKLVFEHSFNNPDLQHLVSHFVERYQENTSTLPETNLKFRLFIARCINRNISGQSEKICPISYQTTSKKHKISPMEFAAEFLDIDLEDFLIYIDHRKEIFPDARNFKILFNNFTRRYEGNSNKNLKEFDKQVSQIISKSINNPQKIASILELCVLHDNPDFLEITLSKVDLKKIPFLNEVLYHFIELSVERFAESEKNSEQIIKIFLNKLANTRSFEAKYKIFSLIEKNVNRLLGLKASLVPTSENLIEKMKELENYVEKFINHQLDEESVAQPPKKSQILPIIQAFDNKISRK